MIGDDLGGANFLIAELRVLMEVPTPGDDFGFDGIGALIDFGSKLGLSDRRGGNQQEREDDFFHGWNG